MLFTNFNKTKIFVIFINYNVTFIIYKYKVGNWEEMTHLPAIMKWKGEILGATSPKRKKSVLMRKMNNTKF